MPKPRVPQAKAEVSGAVTINPGRFKDRTTSKRVRPIGEPYARMTPEQQLCWSEFRSELPWLNSGHRTILRMACILAARMDTDPEFGVQATQALSSILSKLGATPVDETKVNHAEEEDEDPADKFFGKTH
jgi:hypothetical protein